MSKDFVNKYLNYKKKLTDYSEYLNPVWSEREKELENYFLSSFSSNFLQHPLFRETMFVAGGKKWQNIQLAFLNNLFSAAKLLLLLREDLFGRPSITSLRYLTSHNSIHLLYHLTKFFQETGTKISDFQNIMEWGGGYGRLAVILSRINSKINYLCIDLPVMAFIQATYLSQVLGKNKINLHLNRELIIIPNTINLIPLPTLINNKTSHFHTDLFISTWALSESAPSAQKFVLDNDFFGAKYLLLTYQKRSLRFPKAEIKNLIPKNFTITYNFEIEFLKENYYLFAERQ